MPTTDTSEEGLESLIQAEGFALTPGEAMAAAREVSGWKSGRELVGAGLDSLIPERF